MKIHEYCKQFREVELQKTLQELQAKTGVKLKTISAFENGRSTNINHINIYTVSCETQEQKELFLKGLINAISEA